ncbi:hypothetical protein CC78DRAFT_591957 [Lojkania enalia]|uniref:Uncharacterized protein n=1 Tax=Lojkania enalia TaxID=147567 RepID=A0A9P4KE78_9PLEO|nr:hypothetical protein CC78DRAFT_591957 [Didymosphaeria enalia]
MLKIDVGDALAILRIAQGVLSTFTTLGLMHAFEMVQWALAGREEGLGFSSFLGLSPTTTLWGVLTIALSRVSKISERLWGTNLARGLLVTAIWTAGVVLFIRASVVIAYDSGFTYDVTAGVGQFNASLLGPFFSMLKNIVPEYSHQIVPSTILSTTYSLIGNSMHVTNTQSVDCDDCDSYLLNGGVVSTTPWFPEGYNEYPLANIEDVPTTQVQFRRWMSEEDGFTDENCSTYGAEGFLIGMKVCVSNSNAYPGSITAGLYICPNGTANDACSPRSPLPNITTTMSIYSLKSSLVAARSNFSIIAITDTTPPIQNPDLDIQTYRQALDWILDFNASAIPAPSSIVEHFWNAQTLISSPYWSAELTRTFQSILTFPLWHFQSNNYGNIDLVDQEMITTLPPEFYRKLSLTRPFIKIIIDRPMFIAFLVLEGVALLFTWAVLIWLWITRPEIPPLSSYPIVDFAFKAKEKGYTEGFGRSGNLVRAGDGEVRRAVKGVNVVVQGDRGYI